MSHQHHRPHRSRSLLPMGGLCWGPGRMARLMSEMMGPWQAPSEAEAEYWVPRAEMHQTEDCLIINVELPGVSRGEVEVEAAADAVTVRGQRKAPEGECPEGNVCCTEFCYGPFQRTLPWPVEVKAEEAKSRLADGVLEIRVPLSETAKMKTPRRVEVQ
jgi:HSP20 family protein